jgi:hypothetical protein
MMMVTMVVCLEREESHGGCSEDGCSVVEDGLTLAESERRLVCNLESLL